MSDRMPRQSDYEHQLNPFQDDTAIVRPIGGLVSVEQQRAIAEVQARMIIARSNPRNPHDAMVAILKDCERPTLAAEAQFWYSRGGAVITGASIRLAENIARRWGNIASGIKEISRDDGYSECVAYAWDLETGYYDERQFQVRHWRDTRSGGYQLRDERDIYELIANLGQRRKRAVLLTVIPGDVTEAAQAQCEKTLIETVDISPDAMQRLLDAFAIYGVTKEHIEKRSQVKFEAIRRAQVIQLRKIYVSLKDGMSDPAQWFQGAVMPEQRREQRRQQRPEQPEQPEQAEPASFGPAIILDCNGQPEEGDTEYTEAEAYARRVVQIWAGYSEPDRAAFLEYNESWIEDARAYAGSILAQLDQEHVEQPVSAVEVTVERSRSDWRAYLQELEKQGAATPSHLVERWIEAQRDTVTKLPFAQRTQAVKRLTQTAARAQVGLPRWAADALVREQPEGTEAAQTQASDPDQVWVDRQIEELGKIEQIQPLAAAQKAYNETFGAAAVQQKLAAMKERNPTQWGRLQVTAKKVFSVISPADTP